MTRSLRSIPVFVLAASIDLALAASPPAPAAEIFIPVSVAAFAIEGTEPVVKWKPASGAGEYMLEILPFKDVRSAPFVVERVKGTEWRWEDAPVGTHLVRVFKRPDSGQPPVLHSRITFALRAAPPTPLTTGAQEYRVAGEDFRPTAKDRPLELRWTEVRGAAFYLVELKFDSDPSRPPQRLVVDDERVLVDVASGEDVTWRVRPLGAARDPLGDFSPAVRTRHQRRVALDAPTILEPLAGEEVNAAYGKRGRMRIEWSSVPGADLYRVDLEKKDLSTGESFFQAFTTSASTTTADFELGRTERAAVRLRVRAENGESFSPWDERRFEAVRTDEPLPARSVRAQDFQDMRVSLGLGLSALSVDQEIPVDAAELPNGQAGGLSLGSFQGQLEWWPRGLRGFLGFEGGVGVANFSTTFSQTGATVQQVEDLPASLLKWRAVAKGRLKLSPAWSLLTGLGLKSQPRFSVEPSGNSQSLKSYTYESATQVLCLYHQPRIGSLSLQAGVELSETLVFFPFDLQYGAFVEGRWWLGSFWVGGRGSWSTSSLYYLLTNVGDPTQSIPGSTTTSESSLLLTAGFPL